MRTITLLRTVIGATLILSTAILSTAAMAAPLGSDIGRDPDGRYDSNERLDPEQRTKNAAFTSIDRNGDKVLSKLEVERAYRVQKTFEQLDVDNDGQVTHNEFEATWDPPQSDKKGD